MRKIFWPAVVLGLVLWSGWVWAGEDWRAEFERICGRTGEASSLERVELDALIDDSEKLLAQIEAEGGAGKVYLFRLRKCRDLFVFMRDVGAQGEAGEGDPPGEEAGAQPKIR